MSGAVATPGRLIEAVAAAATSVVACGGEIRAIFRNTNNDRGEHHSLRNNQYLKEGLDVSKFAEGRTMTGDICGKE